MVCVRESEFNLMKRFFSLVHNTSHQLLIDIHCGEITVLLIKVGFRGMRTLICPHFIVSLTSKVEVIFNTPALFDSRERPRAQQRQNCAG